MIYQYALSGEARISQRLQDDLQIEPRGPVLDIIEIVRDPGVRLSSVSTSPWWGSPRRLTLRLLCWNQQAIIVIVLIIGRSGTNAKAFSEMRASGE